MILTTGKVRMRKHQLQTGGGWMIFSAIWRIYEESQVLLKGLKQGPNKWIIGLVGLVCEVLFVEGKHFHIAIPLSRCLIIQPVYRIMD